ncbi:hypothetical protein DICSQDRAFT_146704 [Dichomitus squalens LYAD-421 SS1]|uniref:Homeobox domain-containing protein n=1 Tax=Dichomitus squalens (strain LYAD-421) TaxID=732165 RepID=R7T0Y3_DICSQ|nr:uncharacterized protein DICSQDRAFT_146704 [Dichomitus squalens LYAD-421 SS1]EJF61898.1 hypothetical protein DICSQDRAFT_146704 [Dichomitus squalens LYAD-421 SS1]
MSRNAADAPSSAPSNPTDEQRRRRSPPRPFSNSPSPHTLPMDPRNIPEASLTSNIPSQPVPAASFTRVHAPSAAAPSSNPESSHRRRKRERSSPSGSSSQGDMADTEMEGGTSKPSTSESAPEGPPPKKKRTRTLTTPHQAAVLHALLAQSRFPTTQMREEVGRSIGLSARKVQNQRQKARRPRGQASTTSAPLTRPPQFGPFTNVPPGALSDVSPAAMTAHSGSSMEGFFPRGPGGASEMGYGSASASSSVLPEQFSHSHRDPYLAEDHARSAMPATQLAGPGIPGSSRRAQFDDPAWTGRSQGFPPRPSTAAVEIPESYRLTPRTGRPPGEQGPELTLTLPPVATNVPRVHGPASSPMTPLSAGPYPTLASLSSLESNSSTHRPRSFDDPRRTLPPANVDFASFRPVLNIPPPFTLQPQPQWDDPAFSPYNRRRSPPSQLRGAAPPFGDSPTTMRSPFVPEPLPSISTAIPMAYSGPSPGRSPSTTFPRTRFDPIRSIAGGAPPEHPARPGLYDYTDEPPPST